MAKMKKGKKPKKILTDEEKAQRAEMLRLAALANKRKKEEMVGLYLKNKLENEEKFTKLNTHKINHQWRVLLREAKSIELKNDLTLLAQTFERVNDRKNSILKSLGKEMEESEEQYMMSLRNHLHNLDLLIELQNQRLERMKHSFDEELNMMKREFDAEKDYMVSRHQNQIDDLKDIYVAFDKHFLTKETEARNEYGSTRDEMKNKSLEDKHALRLSLEKKVNSLWTEYQQLKANYTKSTEERRSYYEILKARDIQAVIDIERQMLRLHSVSSRISSERIRLNKIIEEYEEKNRLLREEREKLGAHFLGLKAQINKLYEKQHVKLTKIAIESNAARNKLHELNKLAEQIIGMGEHCRKLEAEEEKVLPFYTSCLTQEEEAQLQREYENEKDENVRKMLRRYAPLDMFYRRFNKVQLERLALLKEKSVHEKENKDLKSLLSQYLNGLALNEDTLKTANTLFVVNGKTNLLVNPAIRDGRVRPVASVKLEAAHIVNNSVTSGILH